MYYRPIPPCMMWYQGAMVEEDEDRDRDLDMLYPQIYFRVMPLVMHHCDNIESKHGVMYCPTKGELSEISDDIYNRLNENMGNIEETRQFGGGFLGDLASILLLRELSRRRFRRRRRRRPFYY